MKSIFFALVLLATSPLFAQDLSCAGQTPEVVQNNFVQLLSQGLVSQGAEFVSKGGGINDSSGEATFSEELVVAKKLFVTRTETTTKNGAVSVVYSMSIDHKVSESEAMSLVKSTVKKSAKGLSEKDAKDLNECLGILLPSES